MRRSASAASCSAAGDRSRTPTSATTITGRWTNWGKAMFVTPGVVVDGKLVTTNLVDINLDIRILLGHSFLRGLGKSIGEVFVKTRPARQSGGQAPSVESNDDAQAAEARLQRQLHLGHVAALV